MSGITQSHTPVSSMRALAVIAAVVLAFAVAAALAVALGDDSATTPEPAAQGAAAPAVSVSGVRYDGGPEEGNWRVAPNPGRPDGGPDEGTRGPGH